MNIETILILLPIFALIAYWGHHNNISNKAMRAAQDHTSKQGLQLLDQGVVLDKIRLSFSPSFKPNIIRTFRFEFSSRGDRRYLGWIVMRGVNVKSVSLQPFIENSLH